MKQPKVLGFIVVILILFNSCNISWFSRSELASISLTLNFLQDSRGFEAIIPASSQARLLHPETTTVSVRVERSGAVISEQSYDRPAGSATMSIEVVDIPVSDIAAELFVACLNEGGILLASGTATMMIATSGSQVLTITLAPSPDAGTTLDIGALSGYNQNSTLTASAGVSNLYKISISDELAEYVISLGLTDGNALFFDAAGKPVPVIAGSPEKWSVVNFGGGSPAYIIFTAPAATSASATLELAKAVYVSSSGSGSGTRSSPLAGASLNTSYSSFTAPVRFLLNSGINYPGKFSLLNQLSIYGGFSSDFATRDIAANVTTFSGLLTGTSDQIFQITSVPSVALDGITISPNANYLDTVAVNYASVRALNSGFRVSACTVYPPWPELAFNSGTASGNIFSAVSISGQSPGRSIIMSKNRLVNRSITWNLGANGGGSTASMNLISIASSTADILISGNIIDGSWDNDYSSAGNYASQTSSGIYISFAQPWIIGNTLASSACTTGASSFFAFDAIRGMGPNNGYVLNNFIFALKEYQATLAETNLFTWQGVPIVWICSNTII